MNKQLLLISMSVFSLGLAACNSSSSNSAPPKGLAKESDVGTPATTVTPDKKNTDDKAASQAANRPEKNNGQATGIASGASAGTSPPALTSSTPRHGSTTISTPSLSQLAVSEEYVCQILRNDVECWGDIPPFAHKAFIKPQQIAGDSTEFCVLDDGNLNCWFKAWNARDFKEDQLPSTSGHVTSFAQNAGRICVIDGGVLKCHGSDSWTLPSDVAEKFNRVTVIPESWRDSGDPAHVCGISERRLSCWESDHYFKNFTPNLTALGDSALYDLTQGNYGVWVLGSDGLSNVVLSSKVFKPKNIPNLVQMSGNGGTLLCGTTEKATAYCRIENVELADEKQQLAPDPELTDVVEVQPAKWGTACALRKNTSVTCWGHNARFSRIR